MIVIVATIRTIYRLCYVNDSKYRNDTTQFLQCLGTPFNLSLRAVFRLYLPSTTCFARCISNNTKNSLTQLCTSFALSSQSRCFYTSITSTISANMTTILQWARFVWRCWGSLRWTHAGGSESDETAKAQEWSSRLKSSHPSKGLWRRCWLIGWCFGRVFSND